MKPVTAVNSGRVRHRPTIWDVPTALWAYGLLRSLAFVAPSWSKDGRIGIGVIPVLVLYVFVLLRRARGAWIALVLLDVISLALLIETWIGTNDAPIAVPVLTGAALVALVLPSTRRYVAPGPLPIEQRNSHGNR